MDLISVNFLLFALVGIFCLRLPLPARARELVILALNAVFFASYYPTLWLALSLLVFVALGYIALLCVRRNSQALLLSLLIGGVVLLFAWLKQYEVVAMLLPAKGFPFPAIGLSYILFRIIHLLTDVSQRMSPCPSLLGYINYCLFFPSFASGPIQRYQDFKAQADNVPPPLSLAQFEAAVSRILLGIAMVMLVTHISLLVGEPLKRQIYDHLSRGHYSLTTALNLAMVAFAFVVNLFANFAGYMHLIIGVMQLAGFHLPENFNQPYLAKNFLDLWARWHITLSDWFKCYLFNPLMMQMTRRWSDSVLAPYLGAIAFFVTFLVMGVWHGTTSLFVVYGVLLGLGATVNKLWQFQLSKQIGKVAYKELLQRGWYFHLSRAMTISYFSLALVCLWIDVNQLSGVNWFRASLMLLESFLILSVIGTVWGMMHDAFMCQAKWAYDNLFSEPTETARCFWMALKTFALIHLLLAIGAKAPEFIYKAF